VQNVFLTRSNIIKLGDFGISRILEETLKMALTSIGTPYYMPPEVLENKPYSFPSDIWSLGCLLYQLCAFVPPFKAETIHLLSLKILAGGYDRSLLACYSPELCALIESML